MTKIIVVTSGKGGVGKTTTSVNLGAALALLGKKTCIMDFDVGLRNVDLLLGLERRVVYDYTHVIEGRARLNQAIINFSAGESQKSRFKHLEKGMLGILPTSQTSNKEVLTKESVEKIFNELKEMGYEYIICDSPAGIEHGAEIAMYFADEAIIVVNPEISSIRDSDRITGIIDAKSRRAELGLGEMRKSLVINRFNPVRVKEGELIDKDQIIEILSLQLRGIIPESEYAVLASNEGIPMVLNPKSKAGMAYMDLTHRLLGQEDLPFRFIEPTPLEIIARFFKIKF